MLGPFNFFSSHSFTHFIISFFKINLFKLCLNNYPNMSLFKNNVSEFHGNINNAFRIIIYERNMYNFLNLDKIIIF